MKTVEAALVVLGNTVADVLVRPIEAFPEAGRSVHVESIDFTFGGCGAHTANTAAKLGVPTALVSSVGDDPVGAHVTGLLTRNARLDTLGVAVFAGQRTSTTVVLVGPTGERSFVCCSGASRRLGPAQVPSGFPARTRLFHYAGFALLPEIVGPKAADLFARARAAGALTSLDLAWKQGFDYCTALTGCLGKLDFAMPNTDEACRISGESTARDAAHWLVSQGVGTALVTQGEGGVSWACRDGSSGQQPAPRVAVVDTTGAGDAFAGAFLTATLGAGDEPRWARLEDRIRFAQAAGALVCTAVGGDAGLRDREQVFELLTSNT